MSSKQGVELTEELIAKIKILSANRIPYRTIRDLTGVALGSVSKYCRGVAKLPKSKCQNPFAVIDEGVWKDVEKERSRTAENLRKARLIGDVDYLIQDHKPGTRFIGPYLKIDLDILQKMMDIPTGYHSPLSMADWAVKYLEGRQGAFLRHFPHKWSDMQLEMFKLWEENKRLMIETFRDAGKTMVADAILLREICENPDNNYFIMSETKEKAGDRVKHIGDALLTNKQIISDYGFLPHAKAYKGTRQSWKSNKITVKRNFSQTDPTLMAFSTQSPSATGAHFAGGIFDDVWSFNLEQNSLRNKEKFHGWYDGELEGCLENAWELWLLTRKGPNDLYQDLEDSQFYAVYKRPAILKFPTDWHIVYKEVEGRQVVDYIEVLSDDYELMDDGNGRFNIEFFLEKKAKMRADKWESEYMLNPIAAHGIYWKEKDLRWFYGHELFIDELRVRRALKLLRVTAFIDLAFGMKARSDFTALTILGTFDKKYYFLELYLKKNATENDIVEMIRKARIDFPMLREVHIEADLQQTAAVRRIQKKVTFIAIRPFLSRQETGYLKKEDSAMRSDLKGKQVRIWTQLEGIIEDNQLYVNKLLRNLKEFKDEFRTFPVCEHFDVLDSLGNNIASATKKAALIFALSG